MLDLGRFPKVISDIILSYYLPADYFEPDPELKAEGQKIWRKFARQLEFSDDGSQLISGKLESLVWLALVCASRELSFSEARDEALIRFNNAPFKQRCQFVDFTIGAQNDQFDSKMIQRYHPKMEVKYTCGMRFRYAFARLIHNGPVLWEGFRTVNPDGTYTHTRQLCCYIGEAPSMKSPGTIFVYFDGTSLLRILGNVVRIRFRALRKRLSAMSATLI